MKTRWLSRLPEALLCVRNDETARIGVSAPGGGHIVSTQSHSGRDREMKSGALESRVSAEARSPIRSSMYGSPVLH